MPVPTQAFFVATIFVLLSLPVSLYEIAMHLENFNRPKLQTRIIRILFMVPIYALDRCAFICIVSSSRSCRWHKSGPSFTSR